ncbi:MAG: ABC transporter substrate-binding protein, partial [Candidatus Gallimonas sp.]
MKKKAVKTVSLVLSSAMALSVAIGMTACGKQTEIVEYQGGTKIVFWGNGDDNENSVFLDLVNQFNREHVGEIWVNYQLKDSAQYGDALQGAFASPYVDVLYIPDESVKSYATQGFLTPLDDYIGQSSEIQLDDMWKSAVERYRYDVNTTTTDGPDAHYYGLPKDIGPTVVFYNEDHFTQAGVKVISVAEEDLAAFNNGTKKDDRGRSKTEAGLPADYAVKPKGFFTDPNGQKWFNNQIAMSWEECVELSTLVQNKQRELHPKNESLYYGYFTEWWFNYGWSVGGDCIEYVSDPENSALNGGYWTFTLMEDTPNYIVADDAAAFTIHGNTYQPGEILSWEDKLTDTKATEKTISSEVIAAAASGQLNELPSQRDAFVEFVRVGQRTDQLVDTVDGSQLYGYGICPAPSTMQGDSGKSLYFKNGYLSMLVDGRWNVVDFREDLCEIPGSPQRGGFNWDV